MIALAATISAKAELSLVIPIEKKGLKSRVHFFVDFQGSTSFLMFYPLAEAAGFEPASAGVKVPCVYRFTMPQCRERPEKRRKEPTFPQIYVERSVLCCVLIFLSYNSYLDVIVLIINIQHLLLHFKFLHLVLNVLFNRSYFCCFLLTEDVEVMV